jgi:bifunctional DNA-binding transcriptional regulator/antitoxin component of YhaV-PrlF toxin-antitoxin module
MEEPVTAKVTDRAIPVPKEVLAEAGISDGDDVYIEVDEDGVLHVERTTFYESSEEFIAPLEARVDE